MNLMDRIALHLHEPPAPEDCAPLAFALDVAPLECWSLVATQGGPYLLHGVLGNRAVTSVVIAVYSRTIARLAERWVVLGRPLDGRWPEFDEADVIRRAAHWIVRMDARSPD